MDALVSGDRYPCPPFPNGIRTRIGHGDARIRIGKVESNAIAALEEMRTGCQADLEFVDLAGLERLHVVVAEYRTIQFCTHRLVDRAVGCLEPPLGYHHRRRLLTSGNRFLIKRQLFLQFNNNVGIDLSRGYIQLEHGMADDLEIVLQYIRRKRSIEALRVRAKFAK